MKTIVVDPADLKIETSREYITPQDHIRKFCEDLQARLLEKFEAGAVEHKGSWTEVDAWQEIGMEIFDIISYHAIHQAQNK